MLRVIADDEEIRLRCCHHHCVPRVTVQRQAMKLAAVKGAVDRHEAVASRHQLTVDGSRQPRSSSDIADELMGLPVGRTHSPDTVGLPVGDEQTACLPAC